MGPAWPRSELSPCRPVNPEVATVEDHAAVAEHGEQYDRIVCDVLEVVDPCRLQVDTQECATRPITLVSTEVHPSDARPCGRSGHRYGPADALRHTRDKDASSTQIKRVRSHRSSSSPRSGPHRSGLDG